MSTPGKQHDEVSFGSDPMDKYSLATPNEIIADGSSLGWLFERDRRANPQKPGRTLSVGFDERNPLVDGFRVAYTYVMRFDKRPGEEGLPAGEHYHNLKDELFQAAHGSFRVVLEDRETKARQELTLDAGAGGGSVEALIYIPAGIAHSVQPLTDGKSTLLVTANHPNIQSDEFPYPILLT